MSYKQFLLSACLLIATTIGFAQNAPTTGLQTYTQQAFSVKYPSAWAIDTSKTMGAEAFFFSPPEGDKDVFKENVNIMVQDLKGYNITLKDYAELSETQIKTLVKNGTIYESKIVKTPLGERYQSIYSMEPEAVKLKLICFCYIKNEKAYLLTFTAEADKFEQFKDAGLQILNSFSFPK